MFWTYAAGIDNSDSCLHAAVGSGGFKCVVIVKEKNPKHPNDQQRFLLVPCTEEAARELVKQEAVTTCPVRTLNPQREKCGLWVKNLKPVKEGYSLQPGQELFLSKEQYDEYLDVSTDSAYTVCLTCAWNQTKTKQSVAYKSLPSGLKTDAVLSHEQSHVPCTGNGNGRPPITLLHPSSLTLSVACANRGLESCRRLAPRCCPRLRKVCQRKNP